MRQTVALISVVNEEILCSLESRLVRRRALAEVIAQREESLLFCRLRDSSSDTP
jgi:hypothetical protein